MKEESTDLIWLESLNLCDIGLANIKLPKTEVLFKNLQCLLISDNKIDKWEYISELNKLSKLEELRFTHNPVLEGHSVESIYYKTVARIGSLKAGITLNLCDIGLANIKLPKTEVLFKNLQCLLISDNKIDKWEYISELNKLSKLEELRFTHNPVLEGHSVESIYYKTVARIGSLKVLNRTRITREERRGAEVDYLKEFGMEWLNCAKNENLRVNFVDRHPRFPVLVQKHGAADEGELEVRSSSLHSNLVRVRLRGETGRELTKSLPRTMQLGRLAAMAQRLFANGSSAQPTLTYHSTKNPDIEVKMDNHLQTLNYYSIEDGDEILVTW